MSVSGIRGVVGQTLTAQVATDVGCAYADHLAGGRIVVGRDSRESGPTLQAALIAGLVAGGCEVIDLGVVGTASHKPGKKNPRAWVPRSSLSAVRTGHRRQSECHGRCAGLTRPK